MAPQGTDAESDDPECDYCSYNSEEEYLDDDSIKVHTSQSEAYDTDYNTDNDGQYKPIKTNKSIFSDNKIVSSKEFKGGKIDME